LVLLFVILMLHGGSTKVHVAVEVLWRVPVLDNFVNYLSVLAV